MKLSKIMNIFSVNAEPKSADSNSWDDEVDVVVVGMGGAGACAALEASEKGADVLVIDRFNGGGATNASGGIFYCGGGTKYQKAAGYEDTPENMYNYLKKETKGVIQDSTLKTFCDTSVENLEFLEKHGVPFDSSACPYKTSYPTDKYYLYYSGNESFKPFNENATPAPRGHRAKGKGISGAKFYGPLKESIHSKGIDVRTQCKAQKLITDSKGNVTGIEYAGLKKGGLKYKIHRFLYQSTYTLRYCILFYPPLARYFTSIFNSLEKGARTYRVRTRKGVIITAGGFIFNRKMIKKIAPKYKKAVPLGTVGDDGSGIKLGMDIGAATAEMQRISAWRFINPPESFVKGIIVDRKGERYCNEMYYGAQTGELMIEHHNDEAFLIIDSELWKTSHKDCLAEKAKWFQSLAGFGNLYFNIKKGDTLRKLAKTVGIDADVLHKSLEVYNQMAETTKDDPMGKLKDFIKPLRPPFYAIDCSTTAPGFACPTISLGGLVVDEETGEVKNEDGSNIKGLYAAGRSAVGVTSKGYVSGLSIADAVFSGRRAGQHAATK